jgi:Zn-dependent M28 family amino/carboxypeptidase
MEYSGSGTVTAPVQAVDLVLPPGATASTSTSGCEPSDFAGFVAGRVALLQRGTCDFVVKAENAENAGASAIIIFNEGQEGRTEVLTGTLGNTADVAIPVVGTSFEVGNELAGLAGATVRISTTTEVETVQTENVLAQTRTGRTDRVVLVGAHLDSVAEGPGINDNGSGTGTTLEVALQMSRLGVQPVNAVRFAFWGAEESGLVGSQFYVDSLSKAQTKDIMLNLNFDMLGSTNFARFIYDGDGGAFGSTGPSGSARIEQVFEQYFASQGLATEPTEFDGRSDYDAFIAAGIPAGGLFTGAEDVKTPEQVALYGGTAGVAYDPCYHEACDNRNNISPVAIDQMSDAVAHAVLTFALSTSSPNGTARSAGSHGEHKGSALRK